MIGKPSFLYIYGVPLHQKGRKTLNLDAKSVTYCHEVPLCIECRKYFFKYINAVKNLRNTTNTNRGGARGGL